MFIYESTFTDKTQYTQLPYFPEPLLRTTMSPSCRCIMCGRTAFVKEIVPIRFRSKRALSTSRGVSFTQEPCPRAPLLTKISTYNGNKYKIYANFS